MKQQNVLLYLLGFFSIASSEPLSKDTPLDIEITETHIRDYSQYFNCENQDLCKFVCFTALNACWDDTPSKNYQTPKKYTYNDCWNLSHACDTIDSGVIPEYKNYYTTFDKLFTLDDNDEMKNIAGVKIPKDAYRCDYFYEGINQSYCHSSEHDHYDQACHDRTPEEMNGKYEGFLQVEFCAMYKEYEVLHSGYIDPPETTTIYETTSIVDLFETSIVSDEATSTIAIEPTVTSSTSIDPAELNVKITESHIRDYKQYFNCKKPDLCKFTCFTALDVCWDNTPDEWNNDDDENPPYSNNDCWNLSRACNSIDSGKIPEYKDYKTFDNYFAMDNDGNGMKNPAGVPIPHEAYRCDLYYDGIDQSYCSSHQRSNYYSDCDSDRPPEDMFSEFKDYKGHMRIEYCVMFKEYLKFEGIYVAKPTESDIHCYIQYFYLYNEDEEIDEDEEREYRLDCEGNRHVVTIYGNNRISENECRKNAELCINEYPAEDCEKLSQVCDAMEDNVMPDFVKEQYQSILDKITTTSTIDATTTTTTVAETISVEPATSKTKTKTTTTTTVAETTSVEPTTSKTKTKTTTTKTTTTTTKTITKTTTTKTTPTKTSEATPTTSNNSSESLINRIINFFKNLFH